MAESIKPSEGTFPEVLKAMRGEVERAERIRYQIIRLADRFAGGTPRPAERTGEDPNADEQSILASFRGVRGELANALDSIETELGRLDRISTEVAHPGVMTSGAIGGLRSY